MKLYLGLHFEQEVVLLYIVKTVFNTLFFFFFSSSYTFCDHAGFKYMGNSDSPSLPEDSYKGGMMDTLFLHTVDFE